MSSRRYIAYFAAFVMISITLTPVALSTEDEGTFREALIEDEGSHGEYKASAPDGFFTENRGQFDDDLRFVASTPFGHAGIGTGSIFLDILPMGSEKGSVIIYDLVGAAGAEPMGIDMMPHRNNYFFGSDPSGWITEVPNYRSVILTDVWDNIDLVYFFSEKGLKYDLILHPGADPDDIMIRVSGQEEITISDHQVELLLPVDGLRLFDDDLNVFYSDGSSNIDASFRRVSEDTYGFELDEYDRTMEVTIDPLIYSTYIGGSSSENAESLDLDGSGNAYITGYTDSSNFPTTSGAYDTSKNSNSDVFVSKLNPTGANLVYSTFIGSSSYDYGRGIVVDSSGNAYVTGYTDEVWQGGNSSNSTYSDFPVTSGAYDTAHDGSTDVFILKLNPSGSNLIYSTLVGSNSSEYGHGIDIDASGNAYVTGYTYSRYFPTTSGAYSTTYAGGVESFVLKLNSSGAKLLFSTFLGGSSSEEAHAIMVDPSGNSFITGSTYSNDFPTTSGAYDTSSNGNQDVFLTKLNSTGKGLVYSTYIGGGSDDRGMDVQIDPNGNAYVTGSTYYNWGGGNSSSGNFPTTSMAYDTSHNGGDDCFVLKIDSNGSSLLYSTYLGGGNDEFGMGLSLDSNGYATATGYTYSYDYPTTWGAYDTSHNSRYDVFVSRLNGNGAVLNYSTFVGGSSYDRGYGIHHSTDDHVVVAGNTRSYDFPTTNSSYDTSNNGNYDCFIFKMDFTVSAPPLQPRALTATLYPDHVQLNWVHPENNGTAPLLGYKIYRYTEGGGNGSGNRSIWFSLIANIGPLTTYRDDNINLGNIYYYYIIAYNSVGDSPESYWANASDWSAPILIADHTSSSCYGGEPHTFVVEAADNVMVKSVRVIYRFLGGWIKEMELAPGTTYNWTGSIDVDIDSPKVLTYSLIITDYYRNYVETDQYDVAILDGLPNFVVDNTPISGTTGDPLTFSVEVKDNTVISEVRLRYSYGETPSTDVLMENPSGNTWTAEIDLQDTLEVVHYSFIAKDVSGYLNTTIVKDIAMKDNDLPELVADETPAVATTGDEHVFLVMVADNIDIASVTLETWYEGMTHDNRTMEEWTGGYWKYTIYLPEDDLSSLHYNYWITDSSENVLKGQDNVLEVRDNDIPEVAGDHSLPTAYTGRTYQISVTALDNIGVSEVWVEYWYGDGDHTNSSAIGGTEGRWDLTIPVPHSLEKLHYIVQLVDTSGNWETSDRATIDVKDRQKPVFVEDRTPVTVRTGDEVAFTVIVADNIETRVVAVEYWYGDGERRNATITGSIEYTYTIEVPVDETEGLNYRFHAMDSSLNWNSTIAKMIPVLDDELPTFSFDTTPETATASDKLTFSIFVDDNVGISLVTVEYWIGDGEHINVTLSGNNPYRTVVDLPGATGTLYYRFHATDQAGNIISTEARSIEIKEKGGGGPSGDDDDDSSEGSDEDTPVWIWILVGAILMFIVLTMVNLWAAMLRRKGKEPEAVPENAPQAAAYPYGAPGADQQVAGYYQGYPQGAPPGEDPYNYEQPPVGEPQATIMEGNTEQDPQEGTPSVEAPVEEEALPVQ